MDLDINKYYGVSIMKLQAQKIITVTDGEITDKTFVIDQKKPRKWLYKGSLPRCMALQHLYSIAPDEFREEEGQLYTDALIDVTFDKDKKVMKNEPRHLRQGNRWVELDSSPTNKKELRREEMRKNMYHDKDAGFFLQDGKSKIKYVRYGRSSSMARTGTVLFVKERLLEPMDEYASMGMESLNIHNATDAGTMAYKALILSSIVGEVEIYPNEILLVEDIPMHQSYNNEENWYSGAYHDTAMKSRTMSITRLNEKGEPEATLEPYFTGSYKRDDEGNYILNEKGNKIIENHGDEIWDGQALADISLFKRAKGYDVGEDETPYAQKGMMLLRNHFTKSCAFSTNILEFVKEKYFVRDADGNILNEIVKDMFGRILQAADIKLIITNNSIKFLKQHKLFQGATKKEREQAAYEFWLKTAGNRFTICKAEKIDTVANYDVEEDLDENYDDYHEYDNSAYQFLNSLPLSRDDIKMLIQQQIEYVERLKNEPEIFKEYLRINSEMSTTQFIQDLFSKNIKAFDTREGKEWKRKIIENYVKKLRRGKIPIPRSINAYMLSNPYEFLEYAFFKKFVGYPIGFQYDDVTEFFNVWSTAFVDGEKLTLFRSPHICAGNVAVATNVKYERREIEYKDYGYKTAIEVNGHIYWNYMKYFNLTDGVIVVNSFNCNIQGRLQNCDFDSDFVYCTPDKTILEAAKKCAAFPTPVCGIPEADEQADKTAADVDNKISNNLIPQVVNMSQVMNSYYWELYCDNADGKNDKLLEKISNITSILSSLQVVEIDGAKKTYDVNTKAYLAKIKQKPKSKSDVEQSSCENFVKWRGGVEYKKKYYNDAEREKLDVKYNELKACKNKDMKKIIRADIKEMETGVYEEPKMEYPEFFKYVQPEGNHAYRSFECPMDWLQLEMKIDDKDRRDNLNMVDLLNVKPKNHGYNQEHVNLVKVEATKLKKELERIRSDKSIAYFAAKSAKEVAYSNAINKLNAVKMDEKALTFIISRVCAVKGEHKYHNRNWTSIRKVSLDLLHKSKHREILMNCFISTN